MKKRTVNYRFVRTPSKTTKKSTDFLKLHKELSPYFVSIADSDCGFVRGKPVFVNRTYDGRQMELFI